MADDATTSLIFDATGAQRGADAFAAAGQKIIAANKSVEASEVSKAVKIAAGADAVVAATKRIAEPYSKQTALLERLGKSLDPFGASLRNAEANVSRLNGIIASGGPNAERAATLIGAAQQKLADLQATAQKTTAMEAMNAKLAETSTMLQEVATRTAAATAASREMANAQVAYNARSGAMQTMPLYGQAYDARGADVSAAFADADRQRASVDETFAISKRYEASYNTITNLRKTGVFTEVMEAAAIDRLNMGYKTQIDGMNGAGEAAGHLGHASAGITREFIVMAHEIMMGNFSRLGGSFLVLAERMSTLRDMVHSVGSALTGPVGIGVAAAAGLGAISVAAEISSRHIEALRNALAGVRGDVASLAPQLRDSARSLAATSPLDRAEAEGMLTTVYSNPLFQGSSKQAQDIARAFTALNQVMGDAAGDTKRLAESLNDPARVMQELVDHHIRGFSQALVTQAQLFEDGGNKAAAMSMLLDHLKGIQKDVVDGLTPLQQAMRHLDEAFVKATGSGDGLVVTVGKELNEALAGVIEGFAGLINWINKIRHALGGDWTILGIPLSNLNVFNPLSGPAMGWRLAHPAAPATVPGSTSPVLNNNDAIGMFQLRRDAAADVGMSPDARLNYSANIAGGVMYFRQLLDKFGGSIDDATRAFNQGPSGAQQGRGGAYLASVRERNIGDLDGRVEQDIARSLTNVFSDYTRQGDVPAILNRLDQIALQESGGHHWASGVSGTPSAMTVPPLPSAGDAHGLGTPPNATANLAETLYTKSIEFQRLQLQGQIDQLAKYREGLGATSDAGQHAADAIRDLQIRLDGLKDPLTEQQKMAQAAGDVAAAFAAQSGAARDLLSVQLRFQQLSRDTHQPIDQKALGEELAATQRKLSGTFQDTITQTNLQTRSLEAQIPALELGGRAAEERANHEQAVIEAMKTSVPGTAEYTRQVLGLTTALNKESQAKRDVAAAGDIHGLNDEMTTLQAELRLMTASNGERARELAMLAQRQRYGLTPQDQASPEQQHAIDLAGKLAVTRAQITQTQQAMQELEGVASSALNKMESSVTEPLKQGETAWTRFRDTVVSVLDDISRELLKLAVINPLLNSLFPQSHRPTLGDVGGALGGGGANDNGVGGAGSLVGALAKGGYSGDSNIYGRNGGGFAGSGGGFGGAAPGGMLDSAGGAQAYGHAPAFGQGGIGAPGWLVNQVMGDGFYQNGGLLGSWLHPGYDPAASGFNGDIASSGGQALQSMGFVTPLSDSAGTAGTAGASAASSAAIDTGAMAADSGSWFADIGESIASFFHGGGLVGAGGRLGSVPASAFLDAPRYHMGLRNDEFPAILQDGERVLTANQNDRMEKLIAGLSSQRGDAPTQGGDSSSRAGDTHYHNWNIQGDADSFNRSRSQVQSTVTAAMQRARMRNMP